MADADVIVVGAGVMGAATAHALAHAGADVSVLEQFEVGHRQGSSHGASRIFRLSYHDARYVEMAKEALPLWRALEEESGKILLTRTGGLDLGSALELHASALRECRVDHELISGSEAARRFPALSLPSDQPTLYQRDAGIVAAEESVRTLVSLAKSHGARLMEQVEVSGLEADGERAVVHTGEATLTAPAVVVTAGAWARDLLARAGLHIATRPTRETVAYFGVPEGMAIPAVVDWGTPAVYALPSPGQGIKAGEHQAGPTVDPSTRGAPDEESVDRLSRWIRQRYPQAEPEPHHVETCLYTNAPGDEFILERRGPIVVGSACSGHGFKFAPLIGQRLAGLVSSSG